MKTKLFVYKDKMNWYKYLIPTWINKELCRDDIAEEEPKKFWRWLNLGWLI